MQIWSPRHCVRRTRRSVFKRSSFRSSAPYRCIRPAVRSSSHRWLAWYRGTFALAPNAFEVEEVFEVPLDFLMNPANHRRHSLLADGVQREWLSMPYTDGAAERFIWGATAGMLRNLYRFLQA